MVIQESVEDFPARAVWRAVHFLIHPKAEEGDAILRMQPPPPCLPRKATYGIGVMMIGYVVPVKVQQRGVSPIIAHGPAGNAPSEFLGY